MSDQTTTFPKNELSSEQAVEHVVATFADAGSRHAIAPFYVEVALRVLHDDVDRAMELSEHFEDGGLGAQALGVFAASLAHAGHDEQAQLILARAQAAASTLEATPRAWAPAVSWVEATQELLDGSPAAFEPARTALEQTIDVKSVVELATVLAFVGRVDEAFSLIAEHGGRGQPSWADMGHLFELLAGDLDRLEAFIEVAGPGWVAQPEVLLATIDSFLAGDEPTRAAALLVHFDGLPLLDAEARIAAHLFAAGGAPAAVAMLTPLIEHARSKEWVGDEARLLATLVKYEPDVARARLLELADTVDLSDLEHWALGPFLEGFAVALPLLGEASRFGDVAGEENGEHWVTFLAQLEPGDECFETALSRALDSVDRWSFEGVIASVAGTPSQDATIARLAEIAGSGAADVGRLVHGLVLAGELEAANRLRLATPGSDRATLSAMFARGAAEVGHWTAFVSMVDELQPGTGSHYREYEALRGIVWNLWGASPRAALLM